MALWLFRAGRNGEYEKKFIEDGRIYLTWHELNVDLRTFKEKEELLQYLIDNPDMDYSKKAKARNHMSQIWPIAHRMQKGDWVVLPSKLKSALHFGEIVGDYAYEEKLGVPYYHYRDVKWFALDIPRSNFDQDLLYSFGAFMTVCRISRNDAESRVQEMARNKWQTKSISSVPVLTEEDEEQEADNAFIDFEQYANDGIEKYIIRKYKGHEMARLIDAILRTYGFTTFVSPPGPDKGVDILAAPEPLGFGNPRICVQVKTQNSPVDRPTLDQLVGTMQNHRADQGLLVSWGGFKSSIDKERASQFFKVRLWDRREIIEEFKKNYEKLDEELRSEIPLKRIWTLAETEE